VRSSLSIDSVSSRSEDPQTLSNLDEDSQGTIYTIYAMYICIYTMYLLIYTIYNEHVYIIYTIYVYRRTSISETSFSGNKCLSGTIFHAI
jgi:hypothetical protein